MAAEKDPEEAAQTVRGPSGGDDSDEAGGPEPVGVPGNRWMIVAHPEGPPLEDVPSAAIEAAPPALFAASEVLLPRHREGRVGVCRICGETVKRTREHVPMKVGGNRGPIRTHTLEDWLGRSPDGSLLGGTTEQGGSWGFSLCDPCNNNTGSWYGPEYGRWAGAATAIVRQLPPVAELNQSRSVGSASIEFGNVDPGAFVRAVLAGLCTVTAGWGLAEKYPVIREMLLDKRPAELPEPLSLRLAIYLGPMSRLNGPVLLVDRLTGAWQWLAEIAHPPLAALMVLAQGGDEVVPGLDISDFTEQPPGRRCNYAAEIEVGFGHTPLPGDYRPAGALSQDSWLGKGPGEGK